MLDVQRRLRGEVLASDRQRHVVLGVEDVPNVAGIDDSVLFQTVRQPLKKVMGREVLLADDSVNQRGVDVLDVRSRILGAANDGTHLGEVVLGTRKVELEGGNHRLSLHVQAVVRQLRGNMLLDTCVIDAQWLGKHLLGFVGIVIGEGHRQAPGTRTIVVDLERCTYDSTAPRQHEGHRHAQCHDATSHWRAKTPLAHRRTHDMIPLPTVPQSNQSTATTTA